MKNTREHDVTLAFVIVFVGVGMVVLFTTNMLTNSKASGQSRLTKVISCYGRCTYVPDGAVDPVSCGSWESRLQANSTCKTCLNNCIVSVNGGGGGGGGVVTTVYPSVTKGPGAPTSAKKPTKVPNCLYGEEDCAAAHPTKKPVPQATKKPYPTETSGQCLPGSPC